MSTEGGGGFCRDWFSETHNEIRFYSRSGISEPLSRVSQAHSIHHLSSWQIFIILPQIGHAGCECDRLH